VLKRRVVKRAMFSVLVHLFIATAAFLDHEANKVSIFGSKHLQSIEKYLRGDGTTNYKHDSNKLQPLWTTLNDTSMAPFFFTAYLRQFAENPAPENAK